MKLQQPSTMLTTTKAVQVEHSKLHSLCKFLDGKQHPILHSRQKKRNTVYVIDCAWQLQSLARVFIWCSLLWRLCGFSLLCILGENNPTIKELQRYRCLRRKKKGWIHDVLKIKRSMSHHLFFGCRKRQFLTRSYFCCPLHLELSGTFNVVNVFHD